MIRNILLKVTSTLVDTCDRNLSKGLFPVGYFFFTLFTFSQIGAAGTT